MKNLLFIALCLIGFAGAGQNTINMATQYNVERFAGRCLDDLKVSGSIISISDMPFRASRIYDGQTKSLGDKIYAIYINPDVGFQDFRNILAHELVHVWQYENGLAVTGTKIVFNGVNYESVEMLHYDQPHEKEAREIGVVLFEKFKGEF